MLSLALWAVLAAGPEAPVPPSVPTAEPPEATAVASEAAPPAPLPAAGLVPDRPAENQAPAAAATGAPAAASASAPPPAEAPKAAALARPRAKEARRKTSPKAPRPAAVARTHPAAPAVAPTPEELEAPPVPPSLTSKAFLDEIRASAQERNTQKQRRDDERSRLEALAKGIAEARAALRQETERLEGAAKKPADGSAGSPEARAKSYLALAKTVKGMRPEKAAELVSNLDRPLAVELLRRIRPSDAAAILEKLKSETAADLVARMASAGAEAP